jgi:peptide/nickel transport system permease protein
VSGRRFVRWPDLFRSPVGVVAALIVGGFLLLAIIAPPLWSHAASKIDIAAVSQGSTAAHPLGTDALGRDILYRTLVATRLSVLLAVLASALGAAVGIPIGVLPALVGRRLGRLITSAINLAVAFPTLLLAIFIASIVGLGARGAVIGIAAAVAPYFARLSQTLAASVAGADYIAAARVLGVGRLRLTARHVLPNVAEPLLLTLMLTIGDALLALAGLSLLGVGIQLPSYDWGGMLTEGLGRIYVTPIVVVGPAVAIILAALGFNLLGEALARKAARRDGTLQRHLPAPPVVLPPEQHEPVDEPDGAGQGRVLDVRGLTVAFPGGSVPVRDVSIVVEPGEIVGIVGESGSGKSLTAMAIAELLPPRAQATSERRLLFGQDVPSLGKAGLRRLLGRSLAIVYQDPMASLNPALRVGRQLGEVAEVHEGLSRREARRRAVERLRSVRIGSPERRVRNYPYELSGGMRQRVMIAMGLMGTPQLIIADEPTTALDVTVQQQILKLLDDVSASTGAAAILISHDIAVVSQLCGRVLVMYAGRVVEELDVPTLVRRPAHPYTAALLASVPTMESDREQPLVSIPGRAAGPFDDSPGCPFAPRCPAASDRCRSELPVLTQLARGHRVACWHPNSVAPPHGSAGDDESRLEDALT